MMPIRHGETVTRLRPSLTPDPDDPDSMIPDSGAPPAEHTLHHVAWHTEPEALDPGDPPRTPREAVARLLSRDTEPDVMVGDSLRRADGTIWAVTAVQKGLTAPLTGLRPGTLITCRRQIG